MRSDTFSPPLNDAVAGGLIDDCLEGNIGMGPVQRRNAEITATQRAFGQRRAFSTVTMHQHRPLTVWAVIAQRDPMCRTTGVPCQAPREAEIGVAISGKTTGTIRPSLDTLPVSTSKRGDPGPWISVGRHVPGNTANDGVVCRGMQIVGRQSRHLGHSSQLARRNMTVTVHGPHAPSSPHRRREHQGITALCERGAHQPA